MVFRLKGLRFKEDFEHITYPSLSMEEERSERRRRSRERDPRQLAIDFSAALCWREGLTKNIPCASACKGG